MKIHTALAITALLSTPLAVFADAGTDAAEKALVENRELIEKQVASLNLELAKFTKTLKDEQVSREEKAVLIKKMVAAFMIGFPDDCEELVQTLSNILKDKETAEGTKKWILQMFSTMGAKASKAESAIEHCLENSKQYRDKATLAMAFVAPNNVLFQKRMNEILANPDVSDRVKDDYTFRLVVAGRLDDKVLNILLKYAERRGLYIPELLHVAQHAEKLSDANRKRLLGMVKEPMNKSYEASIQNYFRETMLGNTDKAMVHFAESLTVKGDEGMKSLSSLMHLSRLKKSEIKQLAPVLIDLMKKGDGYKSIAYLLSDQAADVPNNDEIKKMPPQDIADAKIVAKAFIIALANKNVQEAAQYIIPEERDEMTKEFENGIPPLPKNPEVEIRIKDDGIQADVTIINAEKAKSGRPIGLDMKLRGTSGNSDQMTKNNETVRARKRC